jgi:carbon storage regulator
MLVLSRRLGEAVMIGPDVVVRVVSVERGKVRLAFSAPAGTLILREELTHGERGREFAARAAEAREGR